MRSGDHSRHILDADYYEDYLSASVSTFKTNDWRWRIRYSYFHKLEESALRGGTVKLFMGGSISSFNEVSDYYYYNFTARQYYVSRSDMG